MSRYPADDSKIVRTLAFCNLLDDQDNKLSPVKMNLWASNLAGVSTVAAAIVAWVGGHTGMLDHVMSVAGTVGGYMGLAHGSHHYDKKLRMQNGDQH